MPLEMSLLEVLALAEKGMNGNHEAKNAAFEAAHNLIRPIGPQQFSLSDIRRKYMVYPSTDYELMRRLDPKRVFIFDTQSHFFTKHGGHELMKEEAWVSAKPFLPNQDSHFSFSDKPVLYNQPSESLTSIVVGRTPAWMLRERLGRFGLMEQVTPPQEIRDSVYVYAEAGKVNLPGIAVAINGSVPISSGLPILYFSLPFPENAPIRRKGIEARVGFLIPITHAYL